MPHTRETAHAQILLLATPEGIQVEVQGLPDNPATEVATWIGEHIADITHQALVGDIVKSAGKPRFVGADGKLIN